MEANFLISFVGAWLYTKDDEVVMAMEMEGRSLRVTTNDYNDPTANRGHDPSPASSRVKSKGGGGRKG
ncbi:hypothetical protein DVH24_038457 [Malus domestica]|uniref:Uncharacterized protein n=1 Tax=Malus domestica TaxID=3750 RepID=A0A498KFE4_MALDO|nr:hypothetical protein DVH24_038457 [Malus domestica]